MNQKGISLADVKLEWCRFVVHNRGVRAAKGKTDYYLLVYELSQTLDWMWRVNEEDGSVELTFNSTQNLLPEWKNLRGPLSHGSDLTFAEFRHAVNMLNAYNTGKDEQYLLYLVGILYRRPGKRIGKADFDGLYREEFNPARIDFYASRVRMMPAYLQWGVYAWFAYFCEYLLSGAFICDGAEVCFSPVFEKREKDTTGTEAQSIGMNSILFSVAESGIFGNVADTDNTLLLKVMLKLLDDKQRADAMLSKK